MGILHRLRRFRQQLFSRISSTETSHTATLPIPEELERSLSTLSDQNQTLVADLESLRREIAENSNLAQHNRAELQFIKRAQDSARLDLIAKWDEQESLLNKIHTESRLAQEQTNVLSNSMVETSKQLEIVADQVVSLQSRLVDTSETFDAALSDTNARVEVTIRHLLQLEKEQHVLNQTSLETQSSLLKQGQRAGQGRGDQQGRPYPRRAPPNPAMSAPLRCVSSLV